MKIFITFFAITTYIFGQDSHFIFMNGGRNKEMNYRTYYNEIRYGYEITKSKGFENSVITSDGSWNNITQRKNEDFSTYSISEEAHNNQSKEYVTGYPPIDTGLKSKEDLKKHIEKLSKSNKKSFTFIINGHGDFGDNDEVGDQVVDLWGVQITWKELSNFLKVIPKSKKIKISTNICNGGGVHYISKTLPNVCSSTAVPSFIPSTSGVNSMSLYTEGFFKDILNNKNSSLASASISAFENDYANVGLGSLSSYDYIDSIIGSGQYNKSNYFDPKINFNTDYLLFKKYDEAVQFFQKPDSFESTFSLAPDHDLHCISCNIKDLQDFKDKDINKLNINMQGVSGLLSSPYADLYNNAKSDLNNNFKTYMNSLKVYNSKMLKLKKEYESLKKKNKDSNVLEKWWYNYEDKLRVLQDKLDDLKKKSKVELQPLLNSLAIIKINNKVKNFLSIATDEQKDKLISLWECEWEKF